ncbi:MAG TPA: gliding motility-associated C-terminal domain-containing protein, partial [Flavobacterium sp.]|nr:gliding motility-associated C-terminal domain-containing protein [Flavobacterium sp.]
AIAITATGGTPLTGANPYQFAWSGPNGFTSNQQDLSTVYAGNYTVVVTDASGCTDTLAVTLNEPPGIQVAVTTTPMSCYNANDASVSLAISGGTGPYTVNWSNLATGTFQNNLAADTYTITITDASNCPKVITVVVDQAPLFDVTPVVREISCFGANDGSINLNFVGGIAPVVLTWSDGSPAGTQRNNLGPGTYSVTITDAKPCVITRTFTLVEPQPLVVSANVTHAFDCNDANSGAINLMVAGGSAPFTYQWTNGATTEDLIAIPAGNYGITVTDARGCTKTATYIVNRQPPLVAVVDTQSDFNCETRYVKQTFRANVTGGVPPYQLQWSSGTVSGANNEIMETEQEGAIVLDVVDAQGCTTQYSFNVEIPVLGEAGFSQDAIAYQTYGYYSIQDPIQFTNQATGDWESIAWDFGDGSFSTDENPIHTYVREAEYVVKQTVTYPFGCVYTAFVTFLVDKGYELMIPNAFTPNGDGLNDTFVPVYKGLDSIQLEIFTTWGEKIYEEKGATIVGWNGEVKDLETENGNYYYKITATTFYGGVITEKGPLVLLK